MSEASFEQHEGSLDPIAKQKLVANDISIWIMKVLIFVSMFADSFFLFYLQLCIYYEISLFFLNNWFLFS